MKVIIPILCLFSCSLAIPNDYNSKEFHSALSNVDNIFPKELVEKLAAKDKAVEEINIKDISTIINEYADQIFENLRKYINNNNLNKVPISDQHLKLKPTGYIDLKNGYLQDFNTISRNEDVVVTYSHDQKKLLVSLPIQFDDLKFYFDYHTKELFISIHGGVDGSVKNVKVHADLSFDFNTYNVSLDHYDMKDSGKVHIHFTGNKIVDWLSNAMASVITTLMGQVVVNEVAKFVRDGLRGIIEQINTDIHKILN
ncbi:unnamed protein product [Phyllotreta striolata]|uniref:Uncharacterized protein n=1 Tax=Phyllotreta striolata TaxID=444603 RepID=A0A9N9XII4_PHYSR|nr:unnamed protein product [Phyllotreta striolata]